MTTLNPRLRFVAVIALMASCGSHAFGQANGDTWQAQSIYQIITDRFFNGDMSNDNADGNFNASAGQGVHGGDFKGIEQKLDYIKALGATAIWISPVVVNANGDYHGYAGSDFYHVDAHWGTLADLQHLIQTAHSKGLSVIDDVVVNHGSQLLNSNDSGYPNFLAPPNGYNLFYRGSQQYAPPFDPGSGQSLIVLFHNNGFIQDFTNTTQVEMGFLEGLDDFRTESSYVQTQMAAIYKFWMDQGFDAFRVDTVKHVDHGFWQSWAPQMRQHASDISNPNFFMFGEVYDQSEAKCGSYTGTQTGPQAELDSTLDYPLYYAIDSVFALGTGNTKQLDDHFAAVDANYDPTAALNLVTFVDNHDQPRFLQVSASNYGYSRLELALAFIYTSRGIPCLYYGTEQGFNGGSDPNNREDMFAGQFEPDPAAVGDNFDMTRPVFQWVATLNNLRRLYPALRSGAFTSLWNNSSGPGLYAYARRLGNQEVIVAMNTSTVDQPMPTLPTSYTSGTVIANVFAANSDTLTVANSQVPAFTVPALSVKMFVAQSQVLPLDPLVGAVNPAHDSANVSTTAKIYLNFTHPMNTASVEGAFSTVPATNARFSWSSDSQTVTCQIIGGMPSTTMMTVQIGTGATDSNGRPLYAPFMSRFTTASGGASDTTPPTVTITNPQQPGTIVNSSGVSGTATDDVNIDNVEESIDNGPWIALFNPDSYTPQKSITWNASLPFQYTPNGPHTISIRAIDTSGNISNVASINVRFFTKPGPYDYWTFAWDSTNGAQSGCNGEFWQSTPPYNPASFLGPYPYGYIGGSYNNSSNYITNVCSNAQFIYTAERYCSPSDTIRYLYDCPPGVYEVTLHEAETFKSGPNQRRFDVYLQGAKSFSNIDIFDAAGGANLAVTFTNQTTVENGQLEVLFKPVYDYARSSGIHVQKIADIYSDSDGIPDWWRLGAFGHATGLAADLSRAGDDPDGDGQTNLQEYLAGTDPLNPSSNLRIIGIKQSGADIGVTWSSVSGTNYQLQRNDSLNPASWMNVGSTSGNSGSTTLWDTGGANRGAQQFYRVVASSQ